MNIELDINEKTPLAEQIRTEIRQLILVGTLRPGDSLPTVRELAVQLGVNFNTTARAYRALDMEGLINTRQGRGTFVREAGSNASREQGPAPTHSSEGERGVTTSVQPIERLLDHLLAEADRYGIPIDQLLEAITTRLLRKESAAPAGRSAAVHRRQYKINRKKRTIPSNPTWQTVRSSDVRSNRKKRTSR